MLIGKPHKSNSTCPELKNRTINHGTAVLLLLLYLQRDGDSHPRSKRSLQTSGLPYWETRDRLTSVDSAARQTSLHAPMQDQAVHGVSSKPPSMMDKLARGRHFSSLRPRTGGGVGLSIKDAVKSSGTALVRKSQRMNSSQRKPEDMCLCCQFGLYGRAATAGRPCTTQG